MAEQNEVEKPVTAIKINSLEEIYYNRDVGLPFSNGHDQRMSVSVVAHPRSKAKTVKTD
jgi:hypothetical protein